MEEEKKDSNWSQAERQNIRWNAGAPRRPIFFGALSCLTYGQNGAGELFSIFIFFFLEKGRLYFLERERETRFAFLIRLQLFK